MKLETLISLFIFVILMLLMIVEREAVYFLGLFAIGWQIPNASKWIAARFRNHNNVEA